NSIIVIRTIIETGANLDSVYCMGATYYEPEKEKEKNQKKGLPNLGIGRGTIIKKAIIDVNARIGDGCRIGIDHMERKDGEYNNFSIVDGIIVIPKNGVIIAGTNI
ncbi:MAG: glucose-1-phosphate adenylyltransferase, partial [Spirochaetales bacterium]|nr:glucose-1-phosphate adenylyltransferase [Spirochaetales bacterium]